MTSSLKKEKSSRQVSNAEPINPRNLIFTVGVKPYVSKFASSLLDTKEKIESVINPKEKTKVNTNRKNSPRTQRREIPNVTEGLIRDASRNSSPFKLDMNQWIELCLKEYQENIIPEDGSIRLDLRRPVTSDFGKSRSNSSLATKAVIMKKLSKANHMHRQDSHPMLEQPLIIRKITNSRIETHRFESPNKLRIYREEEKKNNLVKLLEKSRTCSNLTTLKNMLKTETVKQDKRKLEERELNSTLVISSPVKPPIPNSEITVFSPGPSGYSFSMLEGNNSKLVRRVLKTRYWWKEVSSRAANFRWQQNSFGYRFERLGEENNPQQRQSFNHYEYHREMTTKSRLLSNMAKYCQKVGYDVFDILPISFIINIESPNLEKSLREFSDFINQYNPTKDQNEFKKLLNIKDLPQENYSDSKLNVPLFKPLQMPSSFFNGANLWLLKPPDLNRGRGIKLFNKLSDLENLMYDLYIGGLQDTLKKKKDRPDSPREERVRPATSNAYRPSSSTKIGMAAEHSRSRSSYSKRVHTTKIFVLQKYIEKPLLINGRKFDMRVWALISHQQDLYFFREGYIRTSSLKYDLSDKRLTNKYVHLTNNAIQKNCESYGTYEHGNQMSFKDFEEYLQKIGYAKDFWTTVVAKMKEHISLTVESVREKLNARKRKNCFEIFGFDFIMDEEYKLWLIECNTNPCLEESSPLLEKLIPRMIDDAFKLTLDVIFPPIHSQSLKKKNENNDKYTGESQFQVDRYGGKENLWDYLGNFSSKD